MTTNRPAHHDMRLSPRQKVLLAVYHFGIDSPEARQTAIAFCEANEMYPYYRFALFPNVSPDATIGDQPVAPYEIPCVQQWEIVLKKIGGKS